MSCGKGSTPHLRSPRRGGTEKQRKEALRQASRRALAGFADRYPALASQFFDEIFIANGAGDEVGKFLTRNDDPDPQALVVAYTRYFAADIPELPKACADFLEMLFAEIDRESELKGIVTDRLIRSTAGGVDRVEKRLDEVHEFDQRAIDRAGEGGRTRQGDTGGGASRHPSKARRCQRPGR